MKRKIFTSLFVLENIVKENVVIHFKWLHNSTNTHTLDRGLFFISKVIC